MQCMYTQGNISTRREVVEFRWDTQNTQTLPYWEYWEYMGWKGRERQCGNSPHTSVLMDISNLETKSLFTWLSLGITLVVWIRESGNNSYQEKTRSGKHLDQTIEEKHLPRLRLILQGAASRRHNLYQQKKQQNCVKEKTRGGPIPSGRLSGGRGPCEVSLNLHPNLVEEGDGWRPFGFWRVDELSWRQVEFFEDLDVLPQFKVWVALWSAVWQVGHLSQTWYVLWVCPLVDSEGSSNEMVDIATFAHDNGWTIRLQAIPSSREKVRRLFSLK